MRLSPMASLEDMIRNGLEHHLGIQVIHSVLDRWYNHHRLVSSSDGKRTSGSFTGTDVHG